MRKSGAETEGKKRVRHLTAAVFLILMFVDIGGHAVCSIHAAEPARPLSWCDVMHHGSPAADCPHKRSPFGPQKIFSDEATHRWILLDELTLPVRGTLYTSEPLYLNDATVIARTLEPPFHPPRHD